MKHKPSKTLTERTYTVHMDDKRRAKLERLHIKLSNNSIRQISRSEIIKDALEAKIVSLIGKKKRKKENRDMYMDEKVNFRVSKAFAARIETAFLRSNCFSLNHFIREALDEYFKEKKK